jgi:hypothetical protein
MRLGLRSEANISDARLDGLGDESFPTIAMALRCAARSRLAIKTEQLCLR